MTEREETYIEELIDPDWLENSEEFIWQSERSGWRHIYKCLVMAKLLPI